MAAAGRVEGVRRVVAGDQGADAPWDDLAEWVRHWRAKLCQRVNHPGNYKYAWWFPKKHAPEWERQKYPKVTIEL